MNCVECENVGINDASGNALLTDVPLLCGVFPAGNILGQFAYLAIGSAYIVNVSGVSQDSPDDTNLGTDFQLIWGDSPVAA